MTDGLADGEKMYLKNENLKAVEATYYFSHAHKTWSTIDLSFTIEPDVGNLREARHQPIADLSLSTVMQGVGAQCLSRCAPTS